MGCILSGGGCGGDRPVVLVVSHQGDNSAPDRVQDALERRGAEVWRLDSDRFPLDIQLAVGPAEARGWLETAAGLVPLDRLRGVWVRRLAIGHGLPVEGDADVRAACIGESRRHLEAWLNGLDVAVMGRPVVLAGARDKLLQLRVARQAGLAVPDTLLTNNADSVRDFAASQPHGLVAKMLHAFALGADERVVFTSPVGPEDLVELSGLAASPMVFQQAVAAVAEFRVTVVGARALVARLPRAPGGSVDWREDAATLAQQWELGVLPSGVEAAVIRTVHTLGLRFGAVDLVADAAGTCWFLEVNPAGEWLWLEQNLGLPIADALAEELLREPCP